MVALTFRTTDNTKWGVGTGSDPGGLMAPSQVDINFWNLKQAVELIQTTMPDLAVGIIDFSVDGDQFYANMTDGTIKGPYTLPTFQWRFLGVWQPSTPYLKGDVVSNGAVTYFVLMNHTSNTVFSPGDNDGAGHAYYQVMLDISSYSMATGGLTDQVLAKSSNSDFATKWVTAARISTPGHAVAAGVGAMSSLFPFLTTVGMEVGDRIDEVLVYNSSGVYITDVTLEWQIIATSEMSNVSMGGGATDTTGNQLFIRWTHFE